MKLTKCKCYHKTNSWLPWTEGVCRGTQECDPCTCRGDRTKCDFYDHVREKAVKEVKEAVKQQLDSHGNTCVNCLYNDICVPDEMQICTDFKDARIEHLEKTMRESILSNTQLLENLNKLVEKKKCGNQRT